MAVMFTLIVMQHTKRGGQSEEFVVRQTEFPSARMLIAEVVLDAEGFVEQKAVRFQGVHQHREQRTMQIKKDHDGIITFLAQTRRMVGLLFQIEYPRGEAREALRRRGRFQRRERLRVSIDRFDL